MINHLLLLVLSILICGSLTAVDRVKNFRLERNDDIELLNKRDESNSIDNTGSSTAAMMKSKPTTTFPDEMTAHFEAFGKHFEMKLKRNDNLISKDLKIQVEGEVDASESSNSGAAYNGLV